MLTTIYKDTSSLADGALNYLLSSPNELDSYGDRVGDPDDPQLGWNLTVHKANPVCFFAHNTSVPPIARWENVGVRDGALRGVLKFVPRGVSRFADEISALTSAGFIRGVSVGFKPTRSKPLASGGVHYLRQTLIEASLCGVPALPSALLQAKDLGISQSTIEKVFKVSKNPPLTVGERIRAARVAVKRARALLGKTTNPKSRAVLMRAIAIIEQQDIEQTAHYTGVPAATSSSAGQPQQREAALKEQGKLAVDRMMAGYVPSDDQIRSQYAVPTSSYPGAYKPPLFTGGKPIYRKKNQFGW
jgi:hypothetical protein